MGTQSDPIDHELEFVILLATRITLIVGYCAAMFQLAYKTSLPGIHPRSSSNDSTKRDLATSTSQMLLEALQNFVIPFIHVADGKDKKAIDEVHLGLEAEKLLTALQEFVSAMIMQSRFGQAQRIEVDLEVPTFDNVPSNDAKVESPGTETDSTDSNAGPLQDFTLKKTKYQSCMGRIPEAVREHVFSKMPIRVLHFTDAPRESGTKLQIALLDRNGVCSRVIEEIQTNYSERMFRQRVKVIEAYCCVSEQVIEDRIVTEVVRKYTKYAILSHTWLRGSESEVTYGDWQMGHFDIQRPGYQKLANFCKSAWKDHRLYFGWMDTVCINKDSSSELDESIRSMYKWYAGSAICITYLAETVTVGNMQHDPWFTRGWTLQELLAPQNMTFYGKDWKKFVPYIGLGDKRKLIILDQICKATTITKHELYYPNKMPISRKMQLAARRKVMREEDIAYSLMGTCNVSISIAYGEGAKRAFFRLMTEILNTSPKVVDIFNCAQTGGSSIIPSEPSAYLHCSKDITEMRQSPPIEPLLLTHVGLRMPILLMPSLRDNDPCLKNNTVGDYHATFHLPVSYSWPRVIGLYCLLDKGILTSFSSDRRMFAVLNFGGDTVNISIPARCLAVYFKWSDQAKWNSTSSVIRQIRTEQPIVFRLMNRKTPTSMDSSEVYSLKRSELVLHGMTLTTMYL